VFLTIKLLFLSVCPVSIRSRQQTSHGYIWAAWLYCQWGKFKVVLIRLLNHFMAVN